MKRIFLIAGGTVGGLGAVLAITPPRLTATTSNSSLSGSLGVGTSGGAVTKPAATPAATKAAPTSKATAKPTSGATASSSATASASASASATQSTAPAPAPSKTTAAPTQSGYSGTVTGATVAARNYGNLIAVVTFTNGEISKVSASQSPSSWSQNVLPTLIHIQLAARSLWIRSSHMQLKLCHVRFQIAVDHKHHLLQQHSGNL